MSILDPPSPLGLLPYISYKGEGQDKDDPIKNSLKTKPFIAVCTHVTSALARQFVIIIVVVILLCAKLHITSPHLSLLRAVGSMLSIQVLPFLFHCASSVDDINCQAKADDCVIGE